MIPVEEAKKKTLASVPSRPPLHCPLEEAVGRVVAETTVSPYPLPFFDNSAMDGYALRSEETLQARPESPVWFSVTGTVAAGDPEWLSEGSGFARPPFKRQACRIFTGAMIPPGADAVTRQEDVLVKEGHIGVIQPVKRMENIRQQGEEIKSGEPLLEAGSLLTPAAIGLLASIGLREVPIFSPPRIGMIITGSEVVSHPSDLKPGKIFDSNSFSLRAALSCLRLTPDFVRNCPDEKGRLQKIIQKVLSDVDFLLVGGGVSVGDFDFVKEVAAEVGVKEVFWKIRQKPGKPLYFGKTDEGKFFFGLPGNPASALVCFYEYVRPALLQSMGAHNPFLIDLKAPLKKSFRKKRGLTHFMKGSFSSTSNGNLVEILENQGSHMISSLAKANCFVILPEDQEEFQTGGEVEIHLLPL